MNQKNTEFYGVLPQTINKSVLEQKLEELSILGYTVLPDLVGEEELAQLRTKLDAVYATQQKEVEGKFRLEDIHEQNQVRAPLCYDDHFLDVAKLDPVMEMVKAYIGNYFLIHLQIGIINVSDTPNRQSVWHRDLLYKDFVISHPISLTTMLCIDDFNEKTGGTQVVPFSHRIDHMPSQEFIEKNAITIEAKAGSVFLMDSMIIHQAGYNSSGKTRRGLNTMYSFGYMKQQINFISQMNGKYKEDPFLNMLLGYDAAPSPNVYEWRKRAYDKRRK